MRGEREISSVAFGIHEHPFYKQKWRRVLIVVSTALWAGFEVLYAKDGFWSVLSLAVFAYSAWAFLLNWKDTPPPDSSVDG
jgi:hypothetical protein